MRDSLYVYPPPVSYFTQLQIEVYDTAYPKQKVTEYVTITVNRNANVPRFEQTGYQKTVSEDFPLVSEVITVLATDPDGVCI